MKKSFLVCIVVSLGCSAPSLLFASAPVGVEELLKARACKGAYKVGLVRRQGIEFVRFKAGGFSENLDLQSFDETTEAFEFIIENPNLSNRLRIRAHTSKITKETKIMLNQREGGSGFRTKGARQPHLEDLETKKYTVIEHQKGTKLIFYSPTGSTKMEDVFFVESIEFPSPQTLESISHRLGYKDKKIVGKQQRGEFTLDQISEALIERGEYMINVGPMSPHDFGFHALGLIIVPDQITERVQKLFGSMHFARTDQNLSKETQRMMTEVKHQYLEKFTEDFTGDLNSIFTRPIPQALALTRVRRMFERHSYLTKATPLDLITSFLSRSNQYTISEKNKMLDEIKSFYPLIDQQPGFLSKKDIDQLSLDISEKATELQNNFKYDND